MSSNNISRPHGPSSKTPYRHVDIGKPKVHQPVKNNVGATAISGAQYGAQKDHKHGH